MAIVRETQNSGGSGSAVTSYAIPLPSGVQAGDVVVVGICFNGGPGTVTPPTGWKLVKSSTAQTNPDVYLYRRVATGSETSATWSWSNSMYIGYVGARYSGVDPWNPIDVAGPAGESSAGATTFDLSAITTARPGAMLVTFMGVNSQTATITEDSTLLTQVAAATGTSIKSCQMSDGITVAAGSYGPFNFDISQSLALAGVVTALRPKQAHGTILGQDDFSYDTAGATISGQSPDVGVAWGSSFAGAGGGSNTISADGSKVKWTHGGSSGNVTSGILLGTVGSFYDNDGDVEYTFTDLGGDGDDAGTPIGPIIGQFGGVVRYTSTGGAHYYTVSNGSLLRVTAGTATSLGSWSIAQNAQKYRLRVTGSSPTTLKVKSWNTGSSEPSSWNVETTDNTSGNQLPEGGMFGIRGYGEHSTEYAAWSTGDDIQVTRYTPTTSASIYQTQANNFSVADTTWADVAVVAGTNLVPNKKYLILVSGSVAIDSASSQAEIRVGYGATPTILTDGTASFDASLTSTSRMPFQFMFVHTQGATAERYVVQARSGSATFTAVGDAVITVIRLDDEWVSGTDYFTSEVTTDYTTTASWGGGASTTFTPDGTDPWLILGWASFKPLVADGTSDFQMRLQDSVGPTTLQNITQDGEDTTNDIRSYVLGQVVVPSAASHTFSVDFQHAGSTAHTVYASRIFAINLSKFAQVSYVRNAGASSSFATSPSWTNVATVSPTPTTTGAWLVLSSATLAQATNTSTRFMYVRQQINPSGGGLASDPAYGDDAPNQANWKAGDTIPFMLMAMPTLSSGASRAINLDASISNGTGNERLNDRNIVAVPLLFSTGGGSTTYSASFTADAHIKRVGISASFTADAFVKRVGLSGSFTADAYVRTTTSASFTSDAFIKKVTSASFTSDAYIKKTTSSSFTSDAFIKKTTSSSFTANAFIKKTTSTSFTADAFVRKAFSASFTADAYVRKTTSNSFTADAYIDPNWGEWSATWSNSLGTTYSASFTADAYIAAAVLGSFTADAFIKKTTSGSITADAFIRRTYSTTFTADAFVRRSFSFSFTADAFVRKTTSGSLTADAFVKKTTSGSFTANAFVKNAVSGSFTANAFIRKTFSGSFTADAIISAVVVGSFTANAFIKKTTAQSFTADANIRRLGIATSFTADAFVRRTTSASVTADAYIRKTFQTSLTADAFVKRTTSASFTADAFVRRAFSSSFTADAYIGKTTSQSFTADAYIDPVWADWSATWSNTVTAGAITYTGSFTADSFIKATTAGSLTADAYIKRTGLAYSFTADAYIRKTTAASFVADAYIRKSTQSSFTADAYVRRTFSGSVTADAHIRATVAGSFTADAQISAPGVTTYTGSFTANANIAATVARTFTADAFIRKTTAGTFTADAFVRNVLTGSFTADAHIKATRSFSFTADAQISSAAAVTRTGSFTADAYVKATIASSFVANAFIRRVGLAGSFVADAYIRRTYSGSFVSNAHIKSTLTGSLTADAFIKKTTSGSFTTDAYIKRTFAGSFVADSFIRRTFTGSLTTDAYIKSTIAGSFTANATITNPSATKAVIGTVATARSYAVDLSIGTSLVSETDASTYEASMEIGPSMTSEVEVLRTFEVSMETI